MATQIDAFTTVGNHTWNNPGVSEVEVLVVAGGGGGGGSPHGGGGGAGGLIYRSAFSVSGDQSVTVGAGGAGGEGDNGNWDTGQGGDGGNSVFGGLTALGGGGGGAYSDRVSGDYDGRDGGSGGGATDQSQPGAALQPTSADGGFGNGSTQGTYNSYSSGGGGAGEAGETDGLSNGGDGRYYGDIFGTNYGENGYFAGGGGGAVFEGTNFGQGTTGRSPGGNGGGGDGGNHVTTSESGSAHLGADAIANTGGGGGGSERNDNLANSTDAYGGNGGSGIVLVKYQTAPTAPSSLAVTNVTSSSVDLSWTDNSDDEDGFRIYRSTTSGSTTSDYTQIDSIGPNITTYSDATVSASTTYYYRVSAFNNLGESSLSNEVNTTTPAEVSGTVTNGNTAISGANIYIIDTTNGDLEATATTDVNGDYSADVSPGLVVDVVCQYDDGTNKYHTKANIYQST